MGSPAVARNGNVPSVSLIVQMTMNEEWKCCPVWQNLFPLVSIAIVVSIYYNSNLLFSWCFFLQSNLQLIKLRKGQSHMEQCGVKGLAQGPNSCVDFIVATTGLEPPTFRGPGHPPRPTCRGTPSPHRPSWTPCTRPPRPRPPPCCDWTRRTGGRSPRGGRATPRHRSRCPPTPSPRCHCRRGRRSRGWGLAARGGGVAAGSPFRRGRREGRPASPRGHGDTSKSIRLPTATASSSMARVSVRGVGEEELWIKSTRLLQYTQDHCPDHIRACKHRGQGYIASTFKHRGRCYNISTFKHRGRCYNISTFIHRGRCYNISTFKHRGRCYNISTFKHRGRCYNISTFKHRGRCYNISTFIHRGQGYIASTFKHRGQGYNRLHVQTQGPLLQYLHVHTQGALLQYLHVQTQGPSCYNRLHVQTQGPLLQYLHVHTQGALLQYLHVQTQGPLLQYLHGHTQGALLQYLHVHTQGVLLHYVHFHTQGALLQYLHVHTQGALLQYLHVHTQGVLLHCLPLKLLPKNLPCGKKKKKTGVVALLAQHTWTWTAIWDVLSLPTPTKIIASHFCLLLLASCPSQHSIENRFVPDCKGVNRDGWPLLSGCYQTLHACQTSVCSVALFSLAVSRPSGKCVLDLSTGTGHAENQLHQLAKDNFS